MLGDLHAHASHFSGAIAAVFDGYAVMREYRAPSLRFSFRQRDAKFDDRRAQKFPCYGRKTGRRPPRP